MSLISIIVPAHNQAPFLGQAIASALGQSYESLEVIVVDDGSTDHTSQVVAEFRDRRVRYLYQANRGLAAARNAGLRAAWGRYISFLDADDLFLPDKLARLHQVMTEDDAGLVAGQAIPIDEAGRPAGEIFDQPLPADGSELLLGNPLHVGSVLVRRSWLDRVGPFDESLRSYEDWDLWLRLAMAGSPLRWVAHPVSLYRFHSGQMTRNGGQMTEASIAVLDKVFARADLTESWRNRRQQAYARAYLRAAANAYLVRDFPAAKLYLDRAVTSDPSLLADGGRHLAERFSSWTDLPKVGDPVTFLEDVYRNLPTPLHEVRRRRRQEVGRMAMEVAWESHGRGDVASTRGALWRALQNEPSWLTRRGVISLLVRSFLIDPQPADDELRGGTGGGPGEGARSC